ncbi:Fis family transcriptional regulator [Niastella yeongjuensis]|uniref:Fis family transcriptional regulator n=1 Tax=Niastella yeongjuensis TaxID=354355 RepID=A0A1V9EUP3_9BACT|nr:sigma 54-interacting response regulator [Niastella yeongjuensis]OQP49801.1 Fis family transcriptional regulator [Niastella yeongjuensis]SEP40178.1 regulatory protein, Fis family [Niastella yeongjuensis]
MNKKLLIVEDEFVVANDLRLILTQAGYNVLGIAASVEEAEAYLQQQTPDLVILDIRLNGKRSGIALARKLKDENIAFIYVSANADQKVLEEAKTTEPYGFLIKPFREKDLLVTLDIAWYRHTHSLESKLRREERLQKLLTEIINEDADVQLKILKLAGAIQSFIPFDFMATGVRPLNGERFSDIGYLRLGFDEYQYIGEKELLTITGLNNGAFYAAIENGHLDSEGKVYSSEDPGDCSMNNSLQRLVLDSLRMESYLVFPVSLGYGLSVHYFFYSRQTGIYSKNHLTFLNRIKQWLTDLAEKIIYYETSSSVEKNWPVSPDKNQHKAEFYPGFKSIVGNHHLLLSALDLATQVAPYNTSVLILGESGTGKEKVAQSIHELSTRKKGPFIKVNCAAIPVTLVESELFGHEKGAFTGAIEKRKGKFEQADGGTIFLDEIGELPLAIQTKLLRVLQEREIEYVGGNSRVKVNVRVVAATNRNLEQEVAEGRFRLDLYYRLNVFPITLPPLRERRTDIEMLAAFFGNKFCKAFDKPFHGIADSMIQKINGYNWPGNIRELENVVEQSVVLNDGRSKLQLMRDLSTPAFNHIEKTGINTFDEVKHIQQATEREYITSILKKTKGRIRGANGAAELLNIKPTTLESKMAKLNIRKQDFD